MTFDVQNVDLDSLADVATTGGIAALEELATTGKVAEAAAVEAEPKEAAEEESGTPETEPVAEETPAEKEHAGAVATKDGKGTIPYSVLKGARERATQTEQQNEVLRRQLNELTQRMDGTAAASAHPTAQVDAQIAEMQEKANQLSGDFPELADLLTGQITILQATRQQLSEMKGQHEAERQDREAAAQAEVAETIQEAIDANPVLTAWKEKAGEEWDAAVEMDVLLRSKPEWAGKTFSERFEKAVELVKVMHPEYEVASEATSAEVKKQATPSVKRPPVNSLSDIPGGVPPAAGKREQVEGMSGSALGNRFMGMTPDQVTEYLSALST